MKEQESKHTPGPWKVDQHCGTMIWAAGDAYRNGPMRIADVRGWGHLTGRSACAMSDDKAAAIQDANAHLIAAAPEMYEALKGVTPLCDAINELIKDDEDLRARVMVLFIAHGLEDSYGYLVANALAKAEGKQP